ncbi:MAG: hypothetical protein EBU66_04130 [Bacteroidetes bacterium]|nr:hypothetical protein [bacterium]NBP63855.1 hypothetical protein [Bacteroidota bacterium]
MATFEDWFEGEENYSLRCDRFIDLLDRYSNDKSLLPDVEEWLRTAYAQGYFHAMQQQMDDGK